MWRASGAGSREPGAGPTPEKHGALAADGRFAFTRTQKMSLVDLLWQRQLMDESYQEFLLELRWREKVNELHVAVFSFVFMVCV